MIFGRAWTTTTCCRLSNCGAATEAYASLQHSIKHITLSTNMTTPSDESHWLRQPQTMYVSYFVCFCSALAPADNILHHFMRITRRRRLTSA